MKVIAAGKFKALKVLDLNANKIGNAGTSYLAKADWPKLFSLDL